MTTESSANTLLRQFKVVVSAFPLSSPRHILFSNARVKAVNARGTRGSLFVHMRVFNADPVRFSNARSLRFHRLLDTPATPDAAGSANKREDGIFNSPVCDYCKFYQNTTNLFYLFVVCVIR